MKKATNIEGREIFFSASSADGFTACPRRWWFAKVMGLPEPKDASLSFGTAVHLVLENYLRDGTEIGPGEHNDGREVVEVVQEHIERAKAGLDLLPKPGTYLVENWLPRVKILDTADGTMSVVGKIDMYLPNTGRHGNPYHTGGWPEDVTGHVLDHKTSSDPKRWMPTSEKLASNAQGLLYAGALQKAGVLEPGDVLFTHHYVAKKGLPKSYIVHTTMRHDSIEEHWDRQQGVAQEMVNIASSVRNVAQQGDVRANLSACRSYGRLCPFADACQAHKPKGVFAAIDAFDAARNGQTTQEEPPMSGGLFSKLKGREAPTAPVKSPEPTKNVRQDTKPTVQIVPPDVTSMSIESVSAAMLRDAANVLQTCNKPTDPLTLSECVEILVSELVPNEYHYCVIAAVDPDALQGTQYAALTAHAQETLLSGFPNTQDALLATEAEPEETPAPAKAPVAAKAATPSEDEVAARALLSIHNERGFRSIVEKASIAALKIALETPARRDGAPFDWQLEVIRDVLSGTEKIPGSNDDVFNVVWSESDPRYAEAGREILLHLRGGAEISASSILTTMKKNGFIRPHRSTAERLYANIAQIPGVVDSGGKLSAPGSRELAEPAGPAKAPAKALVQAPAPAEAPAPAPVQAPVQAPAPAPKIQPPVQAAAEPTAKNTEIADMTLILVQATIQGANIQMESLREMGPVQQAIGRVAQRIKAENNMPWELFNNYGDSGPKRVVVELQGVLAREGLPKGVFYVERTDPLVGADMLTVLRQAGAVVVRGVV